MERIKRYLTLIIVVIGYAIPVYIGWYLYSKGETTINSITIGLLGSILITGFGILFDMNKNQGKILANMSKNQVRILANMNEDHDEIINTLGINKQFIRDEFLRINLCNIMNDYIAISTSDPQEKLFLDISKTTIDNCFQTVARLAKGKLKVENDSRRLNYMFSKIEDDTEESVKAITWLKKGRVNWWSIGNPTGRKYLEVQKKAIERNVKIKRIIIISNQNQADLQRLISEQLAIGIKVWTVWEKSVPRELLTNTLICDDKWMTKSYFDMNGKKIGGLVSINKADISEATQIWDGLFPHATEIKDVNKDIVQI